MKNIYVYVVPKTEKPKCFKLKGCNVYYLKKEELDENVEILGFTRFKVSKQIEQQEISINGKKYIVEELDKKEKVTNFLLTENGKYVAFSKQKNNFIPFLFALVTMLCTVVFLLFNNNTNLQNEKKDWEIGEKNGTNISLNKESETSYNTYWGYQNITITEGMTVPFVNKEENSSYAQFILTNKIGYKIYESKLIPPGSHDEWDAYSFYNGIDGEYIHDLTVYFYNPVLDKNNEIVDFEVSMFAATTPDFIVNIEN